MGKSENKTKATEISVNGYIATVADANQRADAEKIRAMMERLSGEPAKMWGPSIIGFGSYHYKYESGREGDMCRIGFSPRKGQTVLYLIDGFEGQPELMARLGKHKTGKSCLYVKKLADVDEAVLQELCARSLAYMAEKYPVV
jgi:Domain of unknown function (DU1801)